MDAGRRVTGRRQIAKGGVATVVVVVVLPVGDEHPDNGRLFMDNDDYP